MAQKVILSLIIPCFNEEKRILKKFDLTYKFLTQKIIDLEMILVNDGSKDKTEKILEEIAKRYKKVKVITYSPNHGKGYAVKKAVLEAKGEIIGFTDADFAISLDLLPEVLELIERGKADIVIGNRKNRSAKLENKPDVLRRVFSFGHSRINNFFLNLGPITDTLCGFKFFKREVAVDLFKNLETYRWFFDLEILIKARQKYRIYQMAVSWEEIRGGQVKILDAIKTSLKEHLLIYSKFFNIRIFSVILLGLILLTLLPFLISPSSLTGRNGDYSDLVWPDYYFIRDSVYRFHQLPLWNPTVFSGIPEIANPQSPLIYPPNVLALILPIDLTIVILIGLHVFIAGFYLYKLARQLLKWSILSSIIFSFGVAFSPFYWSKFSIGHLSMGFAMCLVGPVLYYGFSFLQKEKVKDLLLLSLFLSLQYLNYPTIWYYSCFFGLIASLIFWRDIKKSGWLFLGAGLSLLFILPIFLLQLQAGPLITRSQLSINDLSIPIWSIKRFLTSILMPSNLLTDKETEIWLYSGIFLIAVAVLGFKNLQNKFKLATSFLLGLVLLITLGSRTPVFGFLARFLPGFSYLRVSTRDWFIFSIILAFLGGFFIEGLKVKKQKIFLVIISFDLILFSVLRLWFIPNVMVFNGMSKFGDLLMNDNFYRYYCTSRCLSARDSLPVGVQTADGYHLLISKDYRIALSEAGGFPPPKYTGNIPSFDNFDAQPKASELGYFGVKWVLSNHDLIDTNFRFVKAQNGYGLYENTLSLERMRFSKFGNSIRMIVDTPNYIKSITQGGEDKLILADAYYPGWVVKIDGKKTFLSKENGWARSVIVPSGSHTIEFEYQPFLSLIKL